MGDTCLHCGYINTATPFCLGCGLELTGQDTRKESLPPSTEGPFFLDNMMGAVETLFPSDTNEFQYAGNEICIDIQKFEQESGVFRIGEERFRKVTALSSFRPFATDMILPLLVGMTGVVGFGMTSSLPFSVILKSYVMIFAVLSFVMWFLSPFFIKVNPSGIGKEYVILKNGEPQPSFAGVALYLQLWAVSFLYLLVFPIFLEMIIWRISGRKTAPLLFYITGVSYARRI